MFGYGIFVGTKHEFLAWVEEFNKLRKSIGIDTWNFGNEVYFMD